MKRITAALALTAALTFGATAMAQSQTDPVKPAELKDVPAGHWAQEAIKIAADCGLLRGFPDGTYRGQQPFTRYQAAVVIARLLNVIQNGQCGIGKPGTDGTMIDPAQLEALQNAVQELSADLAQLGVRVAELEDNAVTQDDLARVEDLATQARDLAEAAANGGGGVSPDDLARVEEIANEARDLAEAAASATGADPEALKNLTDQVEAASIAADTALAQARELQDKVDELSGRVDDLSGQVDELTATVEGQADSIAALNDLVVLLNQDVLSLQDRVAQLEASQADLSAQLEGAATQEDLDALREFTTLLRRDQTALQDRVADLEARVTKNEGDIKALDARVSVLEANAFTISGTIGLKYTVKRLWFGNGTGFAPDFDIDRLGITAGTITTGDDANTGNDNARDWGDFSIRGTVADGAYDTYATSPASLNGKNQGLAGPVTSQLEGRVQPSFSLTLAFRQRNLTEASKGYQSFPLTLTLTGVTTTPFTSTPTGQDSNIADIGFKLTTLNAKYAIGGAPVIVTFGVSPTFKFDNYALNNTNGRGDGFVAALSGAGVLPFSMQLTGVYGSRLRDNGDNLYYSGVSGQASIIPGLTGGVYYGMEGPDITGAGVPTTVYGAFFNGALFGLINLEGEHNISVVGAGPAQNASYIKANAALGPFTIGGNFRFVENGYQGIRSTDDGYVYNLNQSGFGVDLGLNLGFASIAAYYDSRSKLAGAALPNGPKGDTLDTASSSAVNFGVSLTLNLLGFAITPSYSIRSENLASQAVAGVNAKHDGSGANALIKGLNLALGYNVTTDGGTQVATDGWSTQTVINAYLDFTIGSAPGFTITPKAYYIGRTRDAGANANFTNFGVGATLGLPFLFGSRLNAGGAYDSKSYTPSGLNAGTIWAFAGLSFDPALLPNSTLSVTFAYRADTNRDGRGFGPSFASPTGTWAGGSKTAGDATGNGGVLYGLYTEFGYYGLTFGYGIFSNTPNGGTQAFGQSFSINYNLKF